MRYSISRMRLLSLIISAPTSLLMGMLILIQDAEATNCVVPSTYATVQSAVDDLNCEIIEISAGLYVETIVVTRSLTIQGAGVDATTLDGGSQWSVISILGENDVTIQDLTVANGRHEAPIDSTVGGGGVLSEGANVTIRNVVLTENSATNGGGIYAINGTLSLDNVSVMDNVAEDSNTTDSTRQIGGGLHIRHSTVNIVDSIIQNNLSGRRGGGLFVTDSTFTLSNTLIQSNTGSFGGGLYTTDSEVVASDSQFEANVATNNGGGIRMNGGELNIIDSSILANHGIQGGGIYAGGIATVSLTRTTVAYNSASGDGAALYVPHIFLTPTNVSIASSEIHSNYGADAFFMMSSDSDGSRVDIDDTHFWDNSGTLEIHTDFTISNSEISNKIYFPYGDGLITNTISTGGGIQSDNGHLALINSTVMGNDGRGLDFGEDSYLMIRNSRILSHTTYGVIVDTYSTLIIIDSEIAYNLGRGASSDGHLTILNSYIHHNQGGGISAGTKTPSTIANSRFSHNSVQGVGGAIYTGDLFATLRVQNSTFNNNSATLGAAITGNVVVENSTFTGNHALEDGIIYANGGGIVLHNSTIVSNTVDGGATISGDFEEGDYSYLWNSVVANTINGVDCNEHTVLNFPNLDSDGSCGDSLTGDPLLDPLQDNGGATQTMALREGSPAIDSGDEKTCLSTDQRGFPRPFGASCDLGAFEFGGVTAFFSVATTTASESDSAVDFSVELSYPSPFPATLDFMTVDGTGLAGEDYISTSGTLEFEAGSQMATGSVSLLDNSLWEPTENFAIVLSDAMGVLIGDPSELEVVILDDDPVRVSMEVDTITISETMSTAYITVSLDVIDSPTVTVQYATWPETATANLDYLAMSGELVFEPHETKQIIAVTILDDSLLEGEETFAVQLSLPVGAVLDVAETMITILDDEQRGRLWLPILFR